MESNYRNKDFEQYVKQNADQYRMFPSEKIWKNIHGTLHTRRKWYGAGLALLLLSTVTAVTWVMVSYPVSENKKVTATAPLQDQTSAASETSSHTKTFPAEIVTADLPFGNQGTAKAPKKAPLFDFGTANHVSVTQEDLSDQTFPVSDIDAGFDKGQFSATVTSPKISSAAVNNNTIASVNTVAPVAINSTIEKTETAGINDFPVNNDPAEKQAFAPGLTLNQPAYTETNYPLTIESVVNTYSRSRKRIDWQLYVTPTVSYRKLTVNKTMETIAPSADPTNASNYQYALANMSDVNEAVTHKPDMGVQVGLSAGYPITKILKVRAGFQFNINRYDIKASLNNPVEAAYDLNGDNGSIDPITAWTYYRNYTGSKSDWLKNYYLSVSFPIGIEMTVLGGEKTNVGVAGTIQPTYAIKNRAYLISTDLKNYATIPWLMRDVNVSTGFEMFVNYTSGKTKWHIGPQVRYQVLSSFNNKYPVKENLFDFGVKVGVSLNQ